MADIQTENGYTQIAHEILEALARTPLTASLVQILLVIIRKTYGWKKRQDAISLSQIVEMTRLSKRTVIYGLQELEAKNLIFVDRRVKGKVKASNMIGFNKNYDSWVVQNSAQQVEKNRKQAKVSSAKLRKEEDYRLGSAKLPQKVVQNSEKGSANSLHIQKIYTKDSTKEKEKHALAVISEDITLEIKKESRLPAWFADQTVHEIYSYGIKKGYSENKEQSQSWAIQRMMKKFSPYQIKWAVDASLSILGKKAPQATNFLDLEEKILKIVAYVKENKDKPQGRGRKIWQSQQG